MELKNIISSEFIIPYLESKFTNFRYYKGGQEFVCNSFLYEDKKRHLSINTSTGKWQDFKIGEYGDFVKLYSLLEKISYQQAQIRLILLGALEFKGDSKIPVPKLATSVNLEKYKEEFNKFTSISIESSPKTELEIAAWKVIYERKLYPYQFFIQEEGYYSGRLIVPFINSNGNVFFWQGRSLFGQHPKYIMPNSDFGLKASDILYPYNEKEDYLVVTEGPIDALSLQLQGVNATCTIGSHISDVQAKLLSLFNGKIIIGYDNDKAGNAGILNFNKQRKKMFIENIYVCQPDPKFKDWNDMHIKECDIKSYIMSNYYKFSELGLLFSN